MHVVDEDGERVDCGDPEHEHYWRRNISGGGRQADWLVSAGMGYWPLSDLDPWPKLEDFGIESNPNYDYDVPGSEYLGKPEDVARFQAAHNAHVKKTYNEAPGISVYKLCNTNDGWWVTQVECESALKLWEQAGKPDVDDGYGDTIPFLKAAAAHAGFRVW